MRDSITHYTTSRFCALTNPLRTRPLPFTTLRIARREGERVGRLLLFSRLTVVPPKTVQSAAKQPQPHGYHTPGVFERADVLLNGGPMVERSEERPERRTNHRLRMLIDDLQSQLRDTRHALEFVRDSVAQLRVDVEDLRRAHNEERPLIAWSSKRG